MAHVDIDPAATPEERAEALRYLDELAAREREQLEAADAIAEALAAVLAHAVAPTDLRGALHFAAAVNRARAALDRFEAARC